MCPTIVQNVIDIIQDNYSNPMKSRDLIEKVMGQISPYLSDQDKITTANLIDKHIEKTHPVYTHMVEQFKLVWYHKLAGKTYSISVFKLDKSVIETQTLKHVQYLHKMAQINLLVHTHNYNKILNNVLLVN